jgi:hypothetical protein
MVEIQTTDTGLAAVAILFLISLGLFLGCYLQTLPQGMGVQTYYSVGEVYIKLSLLQVSLYLHNI